MKTTIMLLLCAFVLLMGCKEQKPEVQETAVETPENLDLTARGEYLVNIMGCVDCHSPKKMTDQGPVPDMDRYLMGYDSSQPLPPIPENVPLGPWALFSGDLTAAVGPWGTSFAANLTPHESGIGAWSLNQFDKAIREGKYKGLDNSRPIMPPMPVESFKFLTDEDVEAIFVYLKTLKPIENIVPAYQPPSS